MFDRGQLHNTPFTYRNCYGSEYSYNGWLLSKMVNGRPADGSFMTDFNRDGDKRIVDSLEIEIDVADW